MWKRLHRMIEKNRNDLKGIALRKYPPFVLSEHASQLDEIPIFVFHQVNRIALESMLQFLTENRYRTLTADEYIECRKRTGRHEDRSVLLTFDDGHKSLYTDAYPLLKLYKLRAVAYIVPGMVHTQHFHTPLCTWKEIREMHESGVLDVQSHSMYHHSIPVSHRVVDFVRPGLQLSFLQSDLAPLAHNPGLNNEPAPLTDGTPIHEWDSRYGYAPAFRESQEVIAACVNHVRCNGGAEYFQQRAWRQRLNAVVRKARRDPCAVDEYETQAEQRSAILNDLIESKRVIEEKLPGKTVRHFCYPWFRGSPLAVRLSGEAGYVSNAWGSLLPQFVRYDQDPLPLPRLAPSYVWRLPGKGRKSLIQVLRNKTEIGTFYSGF